MSFRLLALCLFVFAGTFARAEDMEFFGQHYSRDIGTNVTKLRGAAWVKRGKKRLAADEIEIDYNTNRATATGNVEIQDGDMNIACRYASFNLEGEDAVFEDATIVLGQLVITGVTVKRISLGEFEIEEGTYSNCNLELLDAKAAGGCTLDWKLYGRRISLQMNGYAQIFDALFSVKDLPFTYTPYLIVPVKSARESGVLFPRFTYQAALGSGITLPYFWAIAPWQDLTIEPTFYTKAGYHLGLEYRYAYDGRTRGTLSLFTLGRQYGPDGMDPYQVPAGTKKTLGILGELGINAHNTVALGARSFSRQDIRLVTHPYYTQDRGDFGPIADLGYMRSQLAFTFPGDRELLTFNAQLYQSLVVSKDRGVDKGPVGELPAVGYYRPTTPFLGRYLSYEVDTKLTQFVRSPAFDPLPATFTASGLNVGGSQTLGTGDYLRTGRRLLIEPRLVANVLLQPGIQFQPILKTGLLLYHFDQPGSSFVQRPYVELEVPFSLYLQRSFTTGLSGFEKISHVFQPRVSFATSRTIGPDPTHPFFYEGLSRPLITPPTSTPILLSNPRFDITDQITEFEYFRFELINRFRRKSAADGSISRFFWFQLSQQYNLRTSANDPRYSKRLGPIELLSEISIGRFNAQVQALYPLELTTTLNGAPLPAPVREAELSASLSYVVSNSDRVSLTTVLRNRADLSQRAQSVVFSFFKSLPTFFDLEGGIEYSMLHGEIRGYMLGLHFRSRPRSCWGMSFFTGQNAAKQTTANVNFRLEFGTPTSAGSSR